MTKWFVTYDDGEELRQVIATGKLSLDTTWLFIMDTTRTPSAVILAIPAHRVINVQEHTEDQ